MSSYPTGCKIVHDFNHIMAESFGVPPKAITPDIMMSELGNDEYAIYSLVVALEQKYGIEIGSSDEEDQFFCDLMEKDVQELHDMLIPKICLSRFQNLRD